MPSRQPWQKMQRWRITVRQPGLEALVGYLYLTDRFDRLVSLIKEAADGLHLRL